MTDGLALLQKLINDAAVALDCAAPFLCSPCSPFENVSLPRRNDQWKPLYLICMTARSGSTMLCSVLEKTGLVGRPDEYINPRGPFPMHYKNVGKGTLWDYFSRVHEKHAGPGGIFGIKTPFQDLFPFIERGLFADWSLPNQLNQCHSQCT